MITLTTASSTLNRPPDMMLNVSERLTLGTNVEKAVAKRENKIK